MSRSMETESRLVLARSWGSRGWEWEWGVTSNEYRVLFWGRG